MNKYGLDQSALLVGPLELLGHNILSLRKLEKILDPIDDLQLLLVCQAADVTRAQPAVLILGLIRECFVLQVSLEY